MRTSVPRVRATRQLGAQNHQSITSDPRYMQMEGRDQYGDPRLVPLNAPGANGYRSAQATTAQHAVGMNYTGRQTVAPQSQGTQLGLARVGTNANYNGIPTIEGGNVNDVAYRPGAPGSSPFVSDGPLSENTGRVIRGGGLSAKMDRLRGNYGGLGNGFGNDVVMAGGSLLSNSPTNGIRVVGPRAQAELARTGESVDELIDERRRIMSGVPTTTLTQQMISEGREGVPGDIVAKRAYQQPQLNVRQRRRAEVKDFFNSRRAQSRVPGGLPAAEGGDLGDLTKEQEDVVKGAFTPTTGPDGAPVRQPPSESLRGMYLSKEFQSNPAAAAAALRHQMTQSEFMGVLEEAYGAFGLGQESPDMLRWLQQVGAELGYEVEPGPTDWFVPSANSGSAPPASQLSRPNIPVAPAMSSSTPLHY